MGTRPVHHSAFEREKAQRWGGYALVEAAGGSDMFHLVHSRFWPALGLGIVILCAAGHASAEDAACKQEAAGKSLLDALTTASSQTTVGAVPTTSKIPAGAATQLAVLRPFKADDHFEYRVLVQWDGGASPQAADLSLVKGGEVSAGTVPAESALVTRHVAQAGDTMLSFQFPDNFRGFWAWGWVPHTIYLYACKADNSLVFVSTLKTQVSNRIYCIILALLLTIVTYFLIAVAVRIADSKTLKRRPDNKWSWKLADGRPVHPLRYLDPVLLTEGANGRGSLSKLQIFFFSVIVFGMISYILMRTGVLSDLSGTVLTLLGISAVGAAASSGTDISLNRLTFENWVWLIQKRWLPPHGLEQVHHARWRDIVTTDGEFDVYHFQMLVFSLVVGGALLSTGLTDLASFEVPTTLLGILGLSQVVYVGGKLVAPTSIADLDKAVTNLRELERDFRETALKTADPGPPAPAGAAAGPAADAAKAAADHHAAAAGAAAAADDHAAAVTPPHPTAAAGTPPLAPPANLEEAIRRAGRDKYNAYEKAAKIAFEMFRSATGFDPESEMPEPTGDQPKLVPNLDPDYA
jgi:hypothetical protein